MVSPAEIPMGNRLITGAGQRYWELSRALSRKGWDVVLAGPGARSEMIDADGLRLANWRRGNLKSLAENVAAAIVPASLSPLYFRKRPSTLSIVDLYNPRLAEGQHEYGPEASGLASFGHQLTVTWTALANADLFLCGSQNQRSYYSGMLTLAGRINPLTLPDLPDMFVIVPTGVPHEDPTDQGPAIKGRIVGSSDQVIMWYGGIYPWYDVETFFRALTIVLEKVPNSKLVIIGKNPTKVVAKHTYDKAMRLHSKMGTLGHSVKFLDWAPYHERASYLLDADLGVNAHRPGLESELSVRTRLLDFFWCGVPMVTTEGGLISEYVREFEAGLVVPPEDHHAMAEAIMELLHDQKRRKVMGHNARTAGRGPLSWDTIVEPLHQVLRRRLKSREFRFDNSRSGWFSPVVLSKVRRFYLGLLFLLLRGAEEFRRSGSSFWNRIEFVLKWR